MHSDTELHGPPGELHVVVVVVVVVGGGRVVAVVVGQGEVCHW